MPKKSLTNAELDVLYSILCDGVETLHEQSESQRGLARVLLCALSSFVSERVREEESVLATNESKQQEGYDERTCSYRDSLLG